MNAKRVCEFQRMWSLNAFCVKGIKMIHSLDHIHFCFADCVKNFDSVTSVLTKAC